MNDFVANINCLSCGTEIIFNSTQRCIDCLNSQVNIFENIDKTINFKSCRLCGRMHKYPSSWINMTFGSKDHLEYLLRHIKNLDSLTIIDAAFTAIIKDAKRFVVAIKAIQQLTDSFSIQQTCEITFKNKNFTCPECHKKEMQDFWRAQVQIRQKVENKRTFFYLEQILLKEKIMNESLRFERSNNGVDIFFAERKHAIKLVQLVQTKIPCKIIETSKLISEDVKNASANIKYTLCIQIAPICRDSVVFLSQKIAQKHGNISRIVICWKINANIHVIDPFTKQTAVIGAKEYFQDPFQMLADHKSLQKYLVVNVDQHYEDKRQNTMNKRIIKSKNLSKSKNKNIKEKINNSSMNINGSKQIDNDTQDLVSSNIKLHENPNKVSKFKLANLQLLQCHSDGTYGCEFQDTTTHLGNIIHINDIVLVSNIKFSHDDEASQYLDDHQMFSSLIVVKKLDLERKRNRRDLRTFRLKRMKSQQIPSSSSIIDLDTDDNEFEDFLEEIEDDVEIRQNVDLYRDDAKIMDLKNQGRLELLEKFTDIKISDLIQSMEI